MFRGSIVALVTPFKDGLVDVEKLSALVEFHVKEGTDAIVAAGTTGESGTLSHEEKMLVIKTVVAAANERLPVIAGTGTQSTKETIQITKEAIVLGAHAALIMTPAYIKPTQEGLFLHYKAIAEEVGLPIILYNVPSRTAVDLLPETVARLAELPNIIGIKEATGKMERFEAIQQLVQDSRLGLGPTSATEEERILSKAENHALCEGMGSITKSIDIFSGDDLTAAEWLLKGAKGVISVTANIVPRMMAKLCRCAIDKDKESTIAINETLMDLHHMLFIESNPIPAKWALAQMHKINDEIRLPLTPLSTVNQTAMRLVLQKLNLIGE